MKHYTIRKRLKTTQMSKNKKLFEKIMVHENKEYYKIIKGHKGGLCIVIVWFLEYIGS